jgi:hypothetical protein
VSIPIVPDVSAGICRLRPRGPSSLVEAVDFIGDAVAYCRTRGFAKLMVDVRGLDGVSLPTLVDRFLAVEEWARAASGMVTVVLVTHAEYIHPEKFGVMVAADFGLTCDVYTSDADALAWLESIPEG